MSLQIFICKILREILNVRPKFLDLWLLGDHRAIFEIAPVFKGYRYTICKPTEACHLVLLHVWKHEYICYSVTLIKPLEDPHTKSPDWLQWRIQGKGLPHPPPLIFSPPPPHFRKWMTTPPPPPTPSSEGLDLPLDWSPFISYKCMSKDQIIFPLVVILLILVIFLHDYVTLYWYYNVHHVYVGHSWVLKVK